MLSTALVTSTLSYTHTYKCHHYLVLIFFCHPSRNSMPFKEITIRSHLLQPLATLIYFLIDDLVHNLESYSSILSFLCFFNIMFLRFTCVVACARMSFLFCGRIIFHWVVIEIQQRMNTWLFLDLINQ